jgi:hypothetical protein
MNLDVQVYWNTVHLVSYVPGQDQSNSLSAGPRNNLRSISKVGGCTEPEMERETTVDQALIRGLVTAFRVCVSGLSSF